MATLHTTLSGKRGDLGAVHDLVSALERAHHLPSAVVFDINVVLDELLSNTIQYGYAAGAKQAIQVTLSATPTAVEIRIEDDARPFDPLAAPAPDLTLSLADRPIGGLGIHFVRKLMDVVEYRRDNNRNILFLKKNI